MILLDAAFHAPLCAVSKRWPRVVHAAELEEIIRAWPRKSGRQRLIVAPCGASGLRLLGVGGGTHVVLWPPSAKAAELTRCRECWVATGQKRPRRPRSLTRRRP